MGNLDLNYGHISTEGSLAFHYNDCHAYSMRGNIPCWWHTLVTGSPTSSYIQSSPESV